MKLFTFFLFLIFIFSCKSESIYSISLEDLEGNRISFKEFKGRPFAVYVWSGTCVGHTEDLKEINEIYEEFTRRGYIFFSVAIMMSKEDIKKVLEENDIKPKYKILADPHGLFAEKVKLIFLPATIIFDESGNVKGNYPGLFTGFLKTTGISLSISIEPSSTEHLKAITLNPER